MSFNPPWGKRPGSSRPVVAKQRRGSLVPTLVVVGVTLLAVVFASQVWTRVLWFQSVGFFSVFKTVLGAKVLLFGVAALLVGGLLAFALSLAYRTRPIYAPVSPEQASLDRYRAQIEPLRKAATILLPLACAGVAGAAAAAQWKLYLLWLNRSSFGIKDPQFNIDIGFFVFSLPFIKFVLSLVTAAVLVATAGSLVVHYLYGGLRLQGGDQRTTSAARVQLSALVGIFLILRGVEYWLGRYSLTTASHSLAKDFTGMTYSAVNAELPAKTFLTIASVVVGLIIIAAIWLKSWRIPGLAVALLVICAVAVGNIYPTMVQRFQVKPSEASKERLYIERNIAATRTAYGLDDLEVQEYEAKTTATSGQLRNDAATIPGIRLLDPALVSDSFRQLEQSRQYYAFADSLDVDRYTIDGKSRDTVLAVRELDQDGIAAEQRNWVNDHTTYTHGFGVVAAYGTQRESDGKPRFFEKDLPPTGALGTYEPRIYYGEKSPSYSIVGAPKGAPPVELDYPDEGTSGQKNNTYAGKGGVPIGSFPRRLAYSIAMQEYNLLLSDRVNSESKILDKRKPRERVTEVAPWLTVDGDAYPAVVDGRVKWILDGYTTTASYPNSQKTQLGDVTTDSITTASATVTALEDAQVNYIRNSVKATVDAYDGTVTLYQWDEKDPILKTWMKAFPGTVKPLATISADLMSHLRYPEDLFMVQRSLLTKYHVSDPGAFYGGQDFWRIPEDPARASGVDQPPYYLTLQMPGAPSAEFSLTSTFIPSGTGSRGVLTAFAAVDSNPGNVAGQKRAGYGKIRVLALPKKATVSGPGQVQNNFNANPTVSGELNLLRRGESTVDYGNLLTLPVGGGLLYVQPVYVRGSGKTSYPLLQKVMVSFGDKIGFDDTLAGALDQVFGGDSGAVAADEGTGSAAPTPVVLSAEQRRSAALTEAQQAIKEGEAALAKQDFTAYGAAQKKLQAALAKAVSADAEASASATAKPTAGATPGATAAPSAAASPSPSSAPATP